MVRLNRRHGALAIYLACMSTAAQAAAPLKLAETPTTRPADTKIKMGANVTPTGDRLETDSTSLILNGHRWLPVMGEFHYTRYPQSEWRDELLRMKAGGVDVLATYVFWIHHEEKEGVWDWSGDRDLRKFITLAGEVGLKVVVRCGPWCHGEVRNGGLPDWILAQHYKTRSTDPAFLGKATELYKQIATQLKGELWKDGGPVIGMQLDNEFRGPAAYLLALKKIAVDAGLDVPIYTRTGWPELTTPMPFGEAVPLYGAYAEGFWDHALTAMPGDYWMAFLFTGARTDTAIATDTLGKRDTRDGVDTARYPFLTCEIGGGMETSYHRRIKLTPTDTLAIPLIKLGSGSNLLGYYMYHGGTNPEGQLSTMQESIATNYPNDMPVKSYDFEAPIGEAGQINPQYHLLRRLHLFVHDFGEELSTMTPQFPAQRPKGKADSDTLRWSVRSNGQSGYVFVSNYQRLLAMPAKSDVQFDVPASDGAIAFPSRPVTIPADSSFFWPYRMQLAAGGGGPVLQGATAQPVCRVEDGNTTTVIFAETPGVPAEFEFSGASAQLEKTIGTATAENGTLRISNLKPSRDVAILLRAGAKRVQIVLLTEADSLQTYRATVAGKERILLSSGSLIIDGDTVRVRIQSRQDAMVGIYPNADLSHIKEAAKADTVGIFVQYPLDAALAAQTLAVHKIKDEGRAREIPVVGKKAAQAPVDADFEAAAAWKIALPPDTAADADPILRVSYVGDVARLYVGDRLITDNFYNGSVFNIAMKRLMPEVMEKGLTLKILPLRKDAPVYISAEARPDFKDQSSVVSLGVVELATRREAQLKLK